MDIAISFSLSKKPRLSIQQEDEIRLKVMPASFVIASDNLLGASSKLYFASGNVEPAHNTTKYFVPNLR
jgi:hypothetical protein